jgi:hypothetical protein
MLNRTILRPGCLTGASAADRVRLTAPRVQIPSSRMFGRPVHPVPDLIQVVLKIGFEIPEHHRIHPPARPYWPSPSDRPPTPPASRHRTAFLAASARPCSSSRNLPVDQTNQPRMTRPLCSPAITAGSALLRAGPPAHAASVLSASRVMPPERAPSHHPGPGTRPGTGQQYQRGAARFQCRRVPGSVVPSELVV